MKRCILSIVLTVATVCIVTPCRVSADIGADMNGSLMIHDIDNIQQRQLESELESDFQRYETQKQETQNRGTSGQSTIIQGNPGSGSFQAQVEELDTKGVYVNSVSVDPSEILTKEEIEPILSKYAGRNLFITDIQQMINEINNLYASKGFVTAKAYLPEQEVSNGDIHIGLIESRIGNVTIQSNRWTKSKYILDRIPDKQDQLFDIVKLEKDVLDFNRYNEGVKLSANLKAGEKPGTTDIELSADEKFPFHIIGVMDNAGRYSTGSLRGGPVLVADSLFGRRDKLSMGSYFAGGATSPFADYNIPVNKHDGRIGFSYYSTFADVKWGPAANMGLGAKTRSYVYSLYYSQPIIRKTGLELKGYGSLNYKRAWYTMEALEPFGYRPSQDHVTSIDLGLSFRKDTKRGIWWLNQGASMALPLFDSRSCYFKYSGGLLRMHDFSHGVIGQIRANYQIIPNNKDIPYLDQFQAGGLATVRGYSEGILMGKNGYVTSAELMFPLTPRQITSPRTGQKIPFIGQYVKGVAFLDHAGVFPYSGDDYLGGSYFLLSVGMGLRVQLPGDLSARLYWGYPLINNAHETNMTYGRFHFELTLEPNIDKLLRDRSVVAKVEPQIHAESDYVNNYDDIRHYDYFLDGGSAL